MTTRLLIANPERTGQEVIVRMKNVIGKTVDITAIPPGEKREFYLEPSHTLMVEESPLLSAET